MGGTQRGPSGRATLPLTAEWALQSHHIFFLSQALSLNLELRDSETSQPLPVPSPQCWDYRQPLPYLAFHVDGEDPNSRLYSRHFSTSAVSPAEPQPSRYH